MSDSKDDTIVKLTADNAALRAALQSVIDEGSPVSHVAGVASGHLLPASEIDDVRATLASPHPGAGWVSPEEHAKVVEALADREVLCGELNAQVLRFQEQRDAARARLAEVEAERDQLVRDAYPAATERAEKAERRLAHTEAELARVKAEAEGLRAALKLARNDVGCINVEAVRRAKQVLDAALASPTPAQGDEVEK